MTPVAPREEPAPLTVNVPDPEWVAQQNELERVKTERLRLVRSLARKNFERHSRKCRIRMVKLGIDALDPRGNFPQGVRAAGVIGECTCPLFGGDFHPPQQKSNRERHWLRQAHRPGTAANEHLRRWNAVRDAQERVDAAENGSDEERQAQKSLDLASMELDHYENYVMRKRQ